MTAARLRRDVPPQDKALPELAPQPAPSFIPSNLKAATLDDLRAACGRHADGAVAEAEASALGTWVMNMGVGETATPNFPWDVQITAMTLCREAARHEGSWPHHSESPRRYSFAHTSAESVAFAREVYADMLSHWRAAGSPHLASACQSTRLYLKSCLLNRTENAA